MLAADGAAATCLAGLAPLLPFLTCPPFSACHPAFSFTGAALLLDPVLRAHALSQDAALLLLTCAEPALPHLVLQALPYSWTLFYVPMHFLTHEMLLFFTSIWTTNIHDNLHAKVGRGLG